MRLKHLAIGCALCLAGGAAHANLLTNGSFELPVVSSGDEDASITGGGTATQDGWNWNYITGVIAGSMTGGFNGSSLPTGYDESQYAYLQGSSSSVAQSFTLATASNVDITWLYAGRPADADFDGDTSYDVTAGSLSFTGATASGTNFQSASLSGVLAAGTYTLTFQNASPAGDHTMYLDDVVLTATGVPEPRSLALLAFGIVALAAWRHRSAGTDADRKRGIAA